MVFGLYQTSGVLSTAVPTSVDVPVATSTQQSTPSPGGGLLATATGPIGGLVNVVSAGSCGPSGATGTVFITRVRSCLTCILAQITSLSGPNGNIDFLNCGLTSGGWTPPLVHIDDIVSVELSQVAYNPGSAFSACQDFVPLFEKYGQQYGGRFSPNI